MSDNGQDLYHTIPRELDSPSPIFFWEPMEFIMALMFGGMLIAFDQTMAGIIAMICLLKWLPILRRGAKRGAAQHFMWSIGLPVDKALKQLLVSPFHKEFID